MFQPSVLSSMHVRPAHVMIRVVLVAAGIAFTACDRQHRQATAQAPWTPATTQPVSATQPAARGPEYLNLLEAVYRYQFDHNASGQKQRVDYYFLSLDGADPPAELLARFAGHKPSVLPGSLALASAAKGVSHKELGGTGLIFRISRIAWLDASTADVDGGYYEGGLSSSGNTYHVERHDGKWLVTKNTMHWIS